MSARWSDRQQAMLREMGVTLWLPPQTDAIYPAVPGSMSAVTFSRALRMDTARSTAFSTSAAGTCLNSNTVLRLSTAL